MGAKTGNMSQMEAARRQQAMEGQAMRRRSIQQTQASPAQEQGVAPEFAPQAPMGRGSMMGGIGRGPEMGGMPGMGRGPEIPSGINFGPGRANRTPEPGSPEYEQLLQRVRGLGQMRR